MEEINTVLKFQRVERFAKVLGLVLEVCENYSFHCLDEEGTVIIKAPNLETMETMLVGYECCIKKYNITF